MVDERVAAIRARHRADPELIRSHTHALWELRRRAGTHAGRPFGVARTGCY